MISRKIRICFQVCLAPRVGRESLLWIAAGASGESLIRSPLAPWSGSGLLGRFLDQGDEFRDGWGLSRYAKAPLSRPRSSSVTDIWPLIRITGVVGESTWNSPNSWMPSFPGIFTS